MGGKRKKLKPKYKPKPQPKEVTTQHTVQRSEPQLVVFISSRIDDMMNERDAVDRAVSSIPITGHWRFENTPASSQPLEESYLSHVRSCDIFVILLGPKYSEAVALEHQTAVENKKPVLAFAQKGEKSPEQNEFINSLGVKYAAYTNSDDLEKLVFASVLDELIRRFKSTLKQAELPKLIESLPAPVRDPQEVAGCVIVGMEDDRVEKVFELFDVTIPPDNLAEVYPSYEQVYFSDFAEMKEVFDALTRAATKANQAAGDRQKAYMQVLKEQSVEIASRYIMRKRSGKQAPQIEVPGIRYFIWSVAPDVARLMKLMRPAEIHDGATPMRRTKYEYLFKSPDYLLLVFSAMHQASKDAGDDMDEFLRLLISSAMRLRLPNLEDYPVEGEGDRKQVLP